MHNRWNQTMPKSPRSAPSRQESPDFLTLDASLMRSHHVRAGSGKAIALAHLAPLSIGFAARAMIAPVLMPVVRLGWTGLH
jgi:hypothetical protein